jgi:HEAT repeat protein
MIRCMARILATSCLILPLFTSAVMAESRDNEYFPPISEILGDEGLGLPATSSDFRDGLADKPTFQKDVRLLNALTKRSKKAAIRRLGRKGNVRAIAHLAAVFYRDNEHPQVRAAAAMGLGNIGDWRVLQHLRNGLDEESKEIRFAAALAIGRVQSLEAIQTITDRALTDEHWWVRFAAVMALGESKSPHAVPPLEDIIKNGKRWQVRQQAVRSLGYIGSRRSIEVLGHALRDKDPAVRTIAARALGKIGGQSSLVLLSTAYHEERADLPRMMMASAIKKVSGR